MNTTKSNLPAILTVALAAIVIAFVAYKAWHELPKFGDRTNYQLHH